MEIKKWKKALEKVLKEKPFWAAHLTSRKLQQLHPR